MTAQPRLVRERKTWQRGAILQALQDASCHVTAEELHRRLRRGPRPIGLATVYRAVEALVREGLAEPANVGDGKTRYGLTAKHHDHLVCLGCGRWEPLGQCLLRGIPRRLAAGFRVVSHQLEVYGYCARCQKPAA
jgi:Fur family ferric uptake transcriptional regulator